MDGRNYTWRKQGMWWVGSCQPWMLCNRYYLTNVHMADNRSVDGRWQSKHAGMCTTAVIQHHVHLLICCSSFAATSQIPLYIFSRLQGKTNNGGGSGWTQSFLIIYNRLSKRIVKNMQVRRKPALKRLHSTKHCNNVILCNARKVKATKIVATTLTNNQNKINQPTSAMISLRMNPTKKTDYKAVQQLAWSSSLNLRKHNCDYEYTVNFKLVVTMPLHTLFWSFKLTSLYLLVITCAQNQGSNDANSRHILIYLVRIAELILSCDEGAIY